ncbi:ATP-binding cassette domain-containing protein [candidate division KSB1 bacterium]|jgi:ATP-binding cassette subfamily B protein|nr:ATP-binding cassette domain-containing protein [candidate division KSB1 bacterium]
MNSKKQALNAFLYPYIFKYRLYLFGGLVCILFTVFFQTTTPWILRYAIKYIEFEKPAESDVFYSWLAQVISEQTIVQVLIAYAALFLLFAILQAIFRFGMRKIIIGVSREIEYDMRNDYFSHLLSLSRHFYHRHKTGDLMARATNDLEAIRSMMGPGIMHLFNTVLTALVAIIFLLNIDVRLTLFALLPLPVVAVVVNRLLAKINIRFRRIQEQFSTVTAKTQENLSGIRIIKSYVQENHEIENFSQLNRELVNRNLSLATIRASLRAMIEILLGIGIIVVIWLGGIKAAQNQLSIGDLVAFVMYLGMLGWPMIALGWVLNLWQQGLASAARIHGILEEKPMISDTDRTDHTVKKIKGHIEFKNVSFRYSDNEPYVFKDISFVIEPGSSMAIIGTTGSGKSTLVNLLPRLVEPTSGQIIIDGRDYREIPLKILRKHIGYVQQETFLFSDTLEGNIGFGLSEPTIPEIEQATETSQIKLDLDQFPKGLQTVIGERGITLSGGQKQRTAISRAVIKQPKILILDDALSAVDTYTEEQILSRLRSDMLEKTCLLVSHRISTVRDADQIIVLRDGQIAEQGVHDQLIQNNGFYAKLYEKQLLEKSLEEL